MLCGYSGNLKANDLEAIAALEKDLGSQLLALSCSDMSMAQLQADQMAKVQDLESKLGVLLVAVSQ